MIKGLKEKQDCGFNETVDAAFTRSCFAVIFSKNQAKTVVFDLH
jgi:hypothetical protein